MTVTLIAHGVKLVGEKFASADAVNGYAVLVRIYKGTSETLSGYFDVDSYMLFSRHILAVVPELSEPDSRRFWNSCNGS